MKQEKYIDYDIKYHIVLKTKENISNKSTIINIRKLIIKECNNINVDIIKACISKNYVHLFVSTSPNVIISNFVKRIKKSTNQKLNKKIWLDGYFCETAGKVTRKMIREYIKVTSLNYDDNFIIEK